MAIGVDRPRQAVRDGRLGEGGEVAGSVLGRAERGAGEAAGRVVDDADQRGLRVIVAEPAMAAAIGLDHLALAGHPLAPGSMARRAPRPDRCDRSLGQDPAQRPLGHDQPLTVGEELGEVGPVDARVGRRREFDQPVPQLVTRPMGRRPPAVAVDQARGTIGPIAIEQPMDLADRELQYSTCLLRRQLYRRGQWLRT